jgi:hypothetical protein
VLDQIFIQHLPALVSLSLLTFHFHMLCSAARDHSIEDAIDSLLKKHDVLDHHVEHALVSVDDHIANMIGKLEKREDKSESRIGDLESVSDFISFLYYIYIFPFLVFSGGRERERSSLLIFGISIPTLNFI